MFSAQDVMDVFHARSFHEDCKRLCESLRIPYYEIEPASSAASSRIIRSCHS